METRLLRFARDISLVRVKNTRAAREREALRAFLIVNARSEVP